MLRRWRKAAFRRFVFPKRLLSPHGTRAAGHIVPTHIMPRAALKLSRPERMLRILSSPDTHNAACGIDNKTALRVHIGHTEPFSYAKSAQQSLTMRRTDGSIEIQKGHCRSRLPNNRMKFPPTVWKLKADFSYLSSNDDNQ